MPIHPLPQFEADLKELEEARAKAAESPSTVVVRFGALKFVAEYPYREKTRPGCGSKLVVRSHRGTEMAELLTSTCPNSGCGSSVSRKEMLEYIENSGGKDYPFFTGGKVVRIATMEDMDKQAKLEQSKHGLKMDARQRAEKLGLDMRIVDAEPILGGEKLTFFYTAEHRVDFRALVQELAAEHRTRIELRQVGARDEARLTADYEKCGQYCCCKNFLKVLKPVSMRSAKVQKATLDPLKISGRCGRLMCCLRYEDQTYSQLKKNLPNRKKRVGTPEGDGIVIDSQILTQLVRVRLDSDREIAVPVEELTEPGLARPEPRAPQTPTERGRGRSRRDERGKTGDRVRPERSPDRDRPERDRPERGPSEQSKEQTRTDDAEAPSKKRRRRRRRRKGPRDGEGGAQQTGDATPDGARPQSDAPRDASPDAPGDAGPGADGQNQRDSGPRKKRRRRRRRRGGPHDPGGAGPGNSSGGGPQGGDPPSGGSDSPA